MAVVSSPPSSSEDDALIRLAVQRAADEALAILESRVITDPEQPSAWTSLGIAKARVGRVDEALIAFQRALDLAPGHVLSTAYLGVCLHLADRESEAMELLDYQGMIQVSRLLPAASNAELLEFNRNLVDYICSHPTLTWQLMGKATQGGLQTGELLVGDAPDVIQRFREALTTHLVRMLWSEDGNDPPWRLTAWGVALRSGGYQEPHVHQAGIVSGVYYAQIPRTDGRRDAGALRFPRQLPWLAGPRWARSMPPHLVLPTPGMLVVFPSYFWHETVPFNADEERVSIAFDVLPPPTRE